MKILVVEDDEILAKVFLERLEMSGYTVRVAADGEEGISMAKSLVPDCIVLDLLLPKKNGFEVLEVLKTDPMVNTIPVVIVSNLGEDANIKRALSLGAADYYVKGEHPLDEIVEKVKNVLIKSK